MEFAELIKTPRVDNVVLHRPFYPAVEGTLCLTGHHLILSSRRQDDAEELWLLHSNIDSIEKRFVGSLGTIIIKCKDLRIIQLDIPGMEECLNIASSIEALSTLDSVTLMYPFFYRPMFEVVEDGWRSFLPEQEFELLSSVVSWISRVCTDIQIYWSSYLMADTRRYICASSFWFNILQESLIKLVEACNDQSHNMDRWLSKLEASNWLTHIKEILTAACLAAQCIDRFNILQESLIKLVEACNDQSHNMDRWLSKLEASNWLTHIKEILTAACLAAQCIDREGASVLVHGTEGTDSTLQVTSLAQIILDPRCRTIRGFESLVVREWLQAGHPFQQRCAQSAYSNSKQKWEAPVFLLFLDCVWQILRQFPCSFEFSEHFLIMLFEHTYASQFGTFLGNNENERSKLKLQQKTMSLWSWVNRPQELSKYKNPLFEANSLVIWPSVAPQSLQLWEGVFLRWNRSSKFLDEAYEEMVTLIEYNKQLKAKVNALRRKLAELETDDRMQENL
nr:PREDICTED: myotubularin-related protein 9-like [Apteryx mantelli mantelli]